MYFYFFDQVHQVCINYIVDLGSNIAKNHASLNSVIIEQQHKDPFGNGDQI